MVILGASEVGGRVTSSSSNLSHTIYIRGGTRGLSQTRYQLIEECLRGCEEGVRREGMKRGWRGGTNLQQIFLF